MRASLSHHLGSWELSGYAMSDGLLSDVLPERRAVITEPTGRDWPEIGMGLAAAFRSDWHLRGRHLGACDLVRGARLRRVG